MAKRLLDILSAVIGLAATSPLVIPTMLLVWWHDRHSPLYVAERVGRYGRPFRMVKLRSMVVGADKTGVDSTGTDDRRITPVGRFIRRFKIDELPQLWNVLVGDMSLVGPRPNVRRDVDLYTTVEARLLEVRPGVTDFASIVFADEGDVLRGKSDTDLAYNQLIRPGKSRLGLFYVDHGSFWVDIQLCCLTAVAMITRKRALEGVKRLLARLGASSDLIHLAGRESQLEPAAPPGGEQVVASCR